MIFVTVGSTRFDALIKAVDELAAARKLSMPVICQIGSGDYEPQHCEHFRYAPSLEPWLEKAGLLVCHGGTGSVFAAFRHQKRFVAIANTQLADDHQTELLSKLGEGLPILWGRSPSELESLIASALAAPPIVFDSRRLVDNLNQYLAGSNAVPCHP